ncbi:hypothetical protein K458DRAFT_379638 [Lentithecium fluviatile CBS 122367]|uniref:Zn(2)-C6 fungal-type domain-containing protein n=1 Tax=Lentithecium fluviatile CBS 122367 TaxID=1168545 RepID=A0A6G1IEY7_9PLEO|nr:hypothetical protein K458DRAFT_379638 [Lentithecium fluviatile CBS 122367]
MSTAKRAQASRQQPGLACEACRSKKLRCDREQPQCGTCRAANIACVVDFDRLPRGRKGNVKSLQTKIGTLFENLFLPNPPDPYPDANMTMFDAQGSIGGSVDIEPLKKAWPLLDLSDLICADLYDHLYFDRVHPFVPFLNRYRYFRQCRQAVGDAPKPTRALRHAMWTLAASFSTQFQHIQKSLYAQTKMILEELDSTASVEPMTIKELQARTLLIMYEIMHMDFRTAWISAGNCLRLALLLRLHEIDIPEFSTRTSDAGRADLSWSEIEEQRRIFWVVFTLDCFMNLINEAPFRMDEETILTRLPAPEANCQTDQPIETAFISEIISGQRQAPSSSFVEIIITLAISGHCLLHRRRSLAENVHHTGTTAFWDRHRAIEMLLTRKSAYSIARPSHDSVQADPLSLLSNMMSNALVLTMYKLIDSTKLDKTQDQPTIEKYEQKALDAAKGITALSHVIPSLSYFKVHPFTPFPMMICIEFLLSRKSVNERAPMQAAEVWRELQSICSVNNLAQICSSKLKIVD